MLCPRKESDSTSFGRGGDSIGKRRRAVEFCSDYLSNVVSIGLCCPRVDNEISKGGRGVSVCDVSRDDRDETHRLVLENIDEVQPYIEKHFDWIKTTYARHKSDRFIMASQAIQVCYMSDPLDARWSVVLTTQPKDYNCKESSEDLTLDNQTFKINPPPMVDTIVDEIISSREDSEGLWID
uniref:DUF4216 domain-containing protein n=1 Tax=Cannabis sativa TaxID=3483 RepID=A0A803NJH1_CANSA